MTGLAITLTSSDPERLRRAKELCDLIELRLDLFAELDLSAIESAIALAPILLTLRSQEHGGACTLSVQERIALLKRLALLKPAYLDVEEELFDAVAPAVPKGVQIVLSKHGSHSSVREAEGTISKLVTPLTSTVQALEEFLKAPKGQVRLFMGEDSLPLRVMTPLKAAPFTFAALDRQEGPSHLPLAEELIDRYRFRTLSPSTKLYALIGDPVKFSKGVVVHNHFFGATGCDALYVAFRLAADELERFFQIAVRLPLKGVSVTMPHKIAVMPFCDELTEEAKGIGAVNTLVKRGDGWLGANTDAPAVIEAMAGRMLLRGACLTVLGSGGSARAVLYMARAAGMRLHILARDARKRAALAYEFGATHGPLDERGEADAVVNALSHEVSDVPCPVKEGGVAVDFVYKSGSRSFFDLARERRCQLIRGSEIFIRQAALQQLLWQEAKLEPSEARRIIEESYCE